LSHAGPFDGMSIGGNVINPESDKVTTAQLAVDCPRNWA
jgi:hypothetical protein